MKKQKEIEITDTAETPPSFPKKPRTEAEAFVLGLALDMNPEQIAAAEARLVEAKKAIRQKGIDHLTCVIVETVERFQIGAADVRGIFELVASMGCATKVARTSRPRHPTKAGQGAKVSPGVVMFRNPAAPDQTYTGKGRKPFWFVNHIAAGGAIDALRVPTVNSPI